jgi:BirA family biotin operon repressor/biotin-[acetyl-CoA-carboxylase] ligase
LEKGKKLEILYFNEVNSTQNLLTQMVRDGKIEDNIAIVAKRQPKGVGSRGNSWIAKEGDLIFSFVVKKSKLPSDLPISSASIYFGYLLKETINSFGEDIYLKWPNDLYKGDKKVGGLITNLIKGRFIVGAGINLVRRDEFGYLNIETSARQLLNSYLNRLENPPSWRDIFKKYKLEFKESLKFKAHINGKSLNLKGATLCEDGAILINNERVYSLR